jgi:hypothetical protein
MDASISVACIHSICILAYSSNDDEIPSPRSNLGVLKSVLEGGFVLHDRATAGQVKT